jgi:ABC-type transport system involved in multi-copper enzyme maturation permease subunit
MTVWVIAKTTLGEAMRKKILNIFLVIALVLIAISVSFGFLSSPRQELTMVKSMGLGVIALVGMLVALVLGINIVHAEIDKRTIYTVLAKPVRRYEFLLGKFFGGLLTISVNLVLMSAVFMVMVALKNHGQMEFALLKGVLMTFFQLMLLMAVATVFSTFLTPVVNFFLTASVYVVGSLSDFTMSMSQGPGKNIVIKGFYWLLHYLVPNFSNFFTQNPLIHPETEFIRGRVELLYYSYNITYAIVYAAIMLFIATLLFERRDM